MAKVAEQLGFSPTARPRIGLGPILPPPRDDEENAAGADPLAADGDLSTFLANKPGGTVR